MKNQDDHIVDDYFDAMEKQHLINSIASIAAAILFVCAIVYFGKY